MDNIRLLITTSGYLISLCITFFFFFLILFKSERKPIHWLFLSVSLISIIYGFMFIFGTNIDDPALSKKVWLLSVLNIPLALSYFHWSLLLTKKIEEAKQALSFLYGLGSVLFVAMLIFPNLVIPSVEPKMYFDNYPNPGLLYIGMLLFLTGVILYSFYYLLRAHQCTRGMERNQLRYVIVGSIIGFGSGSLTFFLVWNIPLDPVFSIFFGFYNALFAYSVLKHNLMNIRLVVRKAFLYSLLIGALSWIIIMSDTVSDFLFGTATGAKAWIIPIIASVTAVFIGRLYLRKSEEAERIEHEFLTVAAHKLRNPLTRSWYAALFLQERIEKTEDQDYTLSNEDKRMLQQITTDSKAAIDLANTFLRIAEEDVQRHRLYLSTTLDLKDLVKEMVIMYRPVINEKSIDVEFSLSAHLPPISANKDQLGTVLSVLLQNAITYSESGATIFISLEKKKDALQFSIRDQGVGIEKKDLKNIFLHLYRTRLARHKDTEGVGAGLFIAKGIIERHKGVIWAESEGEGKGSTFYFEIPVEESVR